MELRFFTTSGLLPHSQDTDRFIETARFFQTGREALEDYRRLPDTTVKIMGVCQGQVYCGLIRCVPLTPDDTHGTDILLTDYPQVFRGQDRAKLTALTADCVSVLGIRYCMVEQYICPAPARADLPSGLERVFLWADCPGEIDTAVKRLYVDGEGWMPRNAFQDKYLAGCKQTCYPLVTEIFADGLTEDGLYRGLYLTPWEYKLLRRKTRQKIHENRKEN